MIAQLATVVCVLCIAYLFWVDRKQSEGVSAAAWIPLMWMFFAGSRFASQWVNLGPPEGIDAAAYDDGSPLDRNVFLGLILAGVAILAQRRINWRAVVTRNWWLFLFFLFAAISVLWADDPFLSFKRWVKGVGNVVMALIILTEKRPYQALGFVLRRLAYVLLPLSVLFIRFYPDLGRGYHMGMAMFTGVTFQKNSLGQLCMLLGVYFSWQLLFRRLMPVGSQPPVPMNVSLIILPMLLWLLYMSHSATAIAGTIGAVSFFLLVRLPIFRRKPRRIFAVAIVAGAAMGVLEHSFGITNWFIEALGRQPDLTDRTAVWQTVLQMATNPLIGAGYESFWSGGRLAEMWERTGSGILQAHNGYVDTYLNLGIIGVFLLVMTILSGLVSAERQLGRAYAYSVLRIALIMIAVAYNYTEAAFKPLNNVFVLMLIGILQRTGVRGT